MLVIKLNVPPKEKNGNENDIRQLKPANEVHQRGCTRDVTEK